MGARASAAGNLKLDLDQGRTRRPDVKNLRAKMQKARLLMKRNAVFLALLLGVVACDRDIPTDPGSPLPTSVTQILSGIIEPGSNKIETLNIPGGQQLRITLSTLNNASGLPTGGTVTLSLGVASSDGTSCSALQTVSASARLTSHLKAILSAGLYCIEISDTASLPSATAYTLRIIFGSPGGPDPPETLVFESTVVPGGSAARNFEAHSDGAVLLVMDSITPGSVGSLGMAIGHSRSTGAGCEISSYIVASPGSAFVIPVDAAAYCAKAFDLGGQAVAANFAMRIRRP
jgi:hypothetical protein